MGRIVVEVMPKPEILDPQGKALNEEIQMLLIIFAPTETPSSGVVEPSVQISRMSLS